MPNGLWMIAVDVFRDIYLKIAKIKPGVSYIPVVSWLQLKAEEMIKGIKGL